MGAKEEGSEQEACAEQEEDTERISNVKTILWLKKKKKKIFQQIQNVQHYFVTTLCISDFAQWHRPWVVGSDAYLV